MNRLKKVKASKAITKTGSSKVDSLSEIESVGELKSELEFWRAKHDEDCASWLV
jgi:hypothetical protein